MRDLEKKNLKVINQLADILDELKNKGNFTGVLYVMRSGEIIDENIESSMDSKTFASMCASVLEGAIGLSKSIGEQYVNKVIAELFEKTIIIVIIDNSSFLVLILNVQSNSSLIFDQLDGYIKKISSLSLE
jgi:predicted regulator of Ras-like GTPase activity (Roadblock/LC7/MglB family)